MGIPRCKVPVLIEVFCFSLLTTSVFSNPSRFKGVQSRTFGLFFLLDAAVLRHGLRVSLLAKAEKLLSRRLLPGARVALLRTAQSREKSRNRSTQPVLRPAAGIS